MGSPLLNMWQGSVPDVPASHFQRFVVRAAPDETVNVCSWASKGALPAGLFCDLFGSRDTRHRWIRDP